MKSGERVGILGVGSYVPDPVRTNDWWPKEFRERFEERRQTDVTSPDVLLSRARSPAQRIQFIHMLETFHDPFRGSIERRVLPAELPPSFMEIAAAKKALGRAGMDPADLDTLIVYSSPPDFVTPSNAGIVQAALGAKKAQTLAVDTSCASFLTGMMVGAAMIQAGQARYVLVVCSGAQTRYVSPDDPASVNFGDGAGAAVLGAVPAKFGFEGYVARGIGAFAPAVCAAPVKQDLPWYWSGGPFYATSRDVDIGKQVVSTSCDMAAEAVETVLRDSGLSRQQVTHWYSHQPMVWFSAACREAAGLTHTKTLDTFRQHATMGSANIGVVLDHAVERGDLAPGDKLVLYACGAGFSLSASIVTWGCSA